MLFQYLCIYYFTSYVNIVFNFMVVSLHMKVVIALWLVNQCSAMINSTRSKWLLEEHGHIKAEMTQGMVIHGIYVLSIYSPIPSFEPNISK
ncbi:hypothetical protein JHK82_011459 [Glycine max]|uniref:Uncharacterized protein n=1 Tax=Glycine max TaxID=3847 RepID=A0A0R0JUP7_SOYBN|nr:hypothetical protein JHK85_011777 [Glycine max]KAG5056454.1 hypothetical protein JHK86_011450 [Glycine max]KAG5153490.1 hypothetical protein JHK82_011459 [Glycine max]KAH1132238.1 hypothetical protein GYH30_011214 [Glycine max]KRH56642.1 hypothetical protein GLYMA_05G010100v4 [Glycine max]